ncbi:MAG: HRDC domain-containing protein, partial [Lentibacter algarum]
MLVSEEDAPLFSALKAKRRALAEAANLPAYIVFNDKTLIEMVKHKPQSLDDFAMIAGVGQKKLEKYGHAFLSVLAEDAPKASPARRKLAGKPAGSLFDQLVDAQNTLQRGSCGTQKPLTLTNSQLAKVAQMRPQSLDALERLIGDKRTERFGPAFIDLIHGGV